MKNVSVSAAEAVSSVQWRSPAAVTDSERPDRLWPWLTLDGSLTARLRSHCGKSFRVEVLGEGHEALPADDADWVGSDDAHVREVHLCCGATPWVKARTLAVSPVAIAELENLGTQPLGDNAFGRATTRRDSLEIARIEGVDGQPLWARRSILRADDAAFYIVEYFLNGATPWQ